MYKAQAHVTKQSLIGEDAPPRHQNVTTDTDTADHNSTQVKNCVNIDRNREHFD